MQRHARLWFCLLSLGGCAAEDSSIAQRGKTFFLGMKEVDLQTCLGSPDQHSSFLGTDILTYYATSSSSLGFTPPVVGGFSITNSGYCHVTVRVDNGVVTHVIYSGEKNATLEPDAYCAPIMRSCLAEFSAVRPPPQAASLPASPVRRSSASRPILLQKSPNPSSPVR